jgi:hypothetical protein
MIPMFTPQSPLPPQQYQPPSSSPGPAPQSFIPTTSPIPAASPQEMKQPPSQLRKSQSEVPQPLRTGIAFSPANQKKKYIVLFFSFYYSPSSINSTYIFPPLFLTKGGAVGIRDFGFGYCNRYDKDFRCKGTSHEPNHIVQLRIQV